jgi:SAM-dependent methyltransferase
MWMADAVPEGFERVGCPGCGSAECAVDRQGRDWYLDETRCVQVVRCAGCGLCYTNPRPTPERLGAYYPNDYPPHQADANEADERATPGSLRSLVLRAAYGSPAVQPTGLGRTVARAVSAVKSPERFASGFAYQGRGRLLDFGCGNGKFLRRMAALGWDVTGLDLGEQAVAAVRGSGLKGFLGTLPHAELGPRSFDVITMRQSLEHVPNPREVLAGAHALLDDNGLLVVNVPNYASWEISYFGDAALSLQLPRHLLHFTPTTLRALLERSGFEVSSVKQVCRASWIKRSLTRTARRGERAGDKWLRNSLVRHVAAWYWEKRGLGNDLTAMARKRGTLEGDGGVGNGCR